MKSTKPIIIANWKTALPYHTSFNWLVAHTNDLLNWSTNVQLVICPEHIILSEARRLLPISINIGAQSCSAEPPGRATGFVSATSLAQRDITHCIVNHSENKWGYTKLSMQLQQLTHVGLTPIICIESADELTSMLEQKVPIPTAAIIAFEPPSAIGKHAAPIEYIAQETEKIQQRLAESGQNNPIIYGGGVTHQECVSIIMATLIEGFLIGRASSDFQALEKIVSSLLEETKPQEKRI